MPKLLQCTLPFLIHLQESKTSSSLIRALVYNRMPFPTPNHQSRFATNGKTCTSRSQHNWHLHRLKDNMYNILSFNMLYILKDRLKDTMYNNYKMYSYCTMYAQSTKCCFARAPKQRFVPQQRYEMQQTWAQRLNP
jgi:hypothetical protein